ncbi:MAG: hypothetical protein ACRCW0_09390 [Clostridium sp.]
MKKKQIVLITCGVIMIIVVVYNVLLKDSFIPKDNVWNRSKTEVSNEKENSEKDVEETINEEKKDGHVISGDEKLEGKQITSITDREDANGDEFKVGGDIEFDDSIYIVNKVERTKKQKNFKMVKDYPMIKSDDNGKRIEEKIVEIDDAGNITNEFSYFIINITVKNKTDKVLTKNFGEYFIYFSDNNDKSISASEPLLTNKEKGYADKSYFFYDLKPKEEFTTDLIYVMWDDYLDYNNVELTIDEAGYRYRGEISKTVKVRY